MKHLSKWIHEPPIARIVLFLVLYVVNSVILLWFNLRPVGGGSETTETLKFQNSKILETLNFCKIL